ncbi:MAG: hypothetical protein SPK00_03475 [Corynebacterium glucuronolyticum]|nr:hypothetical protein [Mycobacteriaceae bacterium]MDY5833797.1 hypothetical protein [Corynebacterium glucuronolyticum]
MKLLKKGAIATITAVTLTAGLCAPASAAEAESKVSAEFKNDKCVVRIGDQVSEYTKDALPGLLEAKVTKIAGVEKEIKNLEDQLAKQKESNAGTAEQEATQKSIDQKKAELTALTKERIAYKACSEGKSASDFDVDAQALLSSADGKSLSPAGIGVTVAGAAVVVLGLIVAALPQIKPLLPPQIATLIP